MSQFLSSSHVEGHSFFHVHLYVHFLPHFDLHFSALLFLLLCSLLDIKIPWSLISFYFYHHFVFYVYVVSHLKSLVGLAKTQ